ncbi:MAG: IPT/TIG domain-containing protein [Chloroflexota bacterium]|nr:IPT/TIG domain-containing protein [Chloroflexota bacterium]
MKLLSRLAIVFAICLAGIFALSIASPVQAQGSFSLSGGEVSRGKGYMGDEVRIYGSWETAYGSYIYIFYELFNEDQEDWSYGKKVRYEYYEEYETEGFYYFDCDDFEIPESCMGTHEILICSDDDPDDVVDTVEFTVYPFIEVNVTEGPVGTSVGLTGYGWHENESRVEVRFYTKDPGTIYYDDSNYYVVAANQNITVDDYGTWTGVTFQVPMSSKGDHWIYVVGDKADSIKLDKIKGAEFEVTPGISMSPTSGYVGDNVTVTGSGFTANEVGIKVSYDGIQVGSTTADANGAWTATFQVPESAKGVHQIDAYGNYTSATTITDKNYTVKSSASMEPTEGHVGTTLSAAGTGFAAEQVVSIKYDTTEIATTTSSSKGSFSASFPVPKSMHGNHTVAVSDASGSSFSFDFVMESTPPPKPALMLPENNSRLGFIGAVTPTFEWSAVTDPSGVVYYFQLATDAGFFGPIIPGDKELTATNYILPEALALPYGDYYWRVKAVDGAQNDSGWTVTYSFKSGFLPMWGFIAIVAGVVVLIGVLVYLLVVRRRSFYD